MRTKVGVLLVALLSTMVWAQSPGGSGGPGGPPPPGMHGPREFGAWWKNSDVVSKLNLTDQQVKQLEDTFYQHKVKLIDEKAEMEKADLTLRNLMDADNPDQNQVMSAVDQVLAARGKVERETAMMMLDFRKALSVQQWKQLREMHPMGPGFGGARGMFGHRGMRGRPAGPDGQSGPPSSSNLPKPPEDGQDN
jgi:Spy/CpxP family protein refolding chaperone